MEPDKQVKDILAKIQAADDDIRDKKDNWMLYYKLYRNYREHLATKGRANEGLPLAFEWVEIGKSRLFKEFTDRKPYVRVRGQEPADDEPARGIQIYQNYQYGLAKYKQMIYKAASQVYKYGTCIVKYGWKYETGRKMIYQPVFPDYPEAGIVPVMQDVVTYDNIFFDVVDLFDFWIDPEAIDIDEAEWCADRVRRTIDYLEGKAKQGIYKNIAALKADLMNGIEDTGGSENDPFKIEKRNIEGHHANLGGLLKPVEIKTYYTNDRIVSIANDKFIIRDEENIYGRKPFRRGVIIGNEHEFYGIGLIEAGASLARLLEDILNNGLDSLNFVINPERIIDETRIDDAELTSQPGNVIHTVGDVNTAIRWSEMPDISQSLFQFFALLNEVSKRGTGITDYITGQGGGSDTATEAQLMTSQSTLRINSHIEMFGDTLVGPLAGDVHELNKYFVTDEKYVRVTAMGKNPYELVRITPDMFGANVDFVWEHEGRELDQMVQVQQLNQALAQANAMPSLWMIAPIIFGKILEQYGYHDNEEIIQAVNVAKEFAKLAMMQQLMMVGAAPKQGGGLPNAKRYASGEKNTKQSMQKKTSPQRGSVITEAR